MRVHFLGIGGSGASAAAAIAQARGFEVSGCDFNPHTEFTGNFDQSQLLTGHSASHMVSGKLDILAYSPAVLSLDPDNIEVKTAREQGIEVMSWQEFMGKYLEKDKFVIAVCGTHGKSTTTAMIGTLMEDAGLDPTVELGAIVPRWGANYRIGKSKYFSAKREDGDRTKYDGIFVTEADEYNNNFLVSHPDLTVVTNIEWDHPEFFKDYSDYQASFNQFFAQSKKVIRNPDPKLINFELQVPGEFNRLNAAAAYLVAKELGIKEEQIKNSLKNFSGVSRRFELVGEYSGAPIISDFGHHPTEIKSTLEALKQKFPDQKLWVIFQPHMFSRTKALFNDFVQVFQDAKVEGVAILDIYPSREVDTGVVSSKQLVESINRPHVEYTLKEEVLKNCREYATSNDVFLFLGAGDVDQLARELVS